MTEPKIGSYSGKEPWLFGFFLLLLSFLFFYPHLFEFPSHLHAWTQSDRFALAVGYFKNGLNLFLPSTLNLYPKYPPAQGIETFNGITSAALPLPEYLSALVMKLTGQQHPAYLRTIVLLAGLIGLTMFYLTARRTGAVASFALLATLFVFSSPVFTYYLNGFIPGIPALSLGFISLYFYVKYLQLAHTKYFALSMALLTLAALIRPPFLMPLIALVMVQLIFWKGNPNIELEMKLAGLHLFVFVAFWVFDRRISATYGSMFNHHLLPASSFQDWKELMATSWKNWRLAYFSGYHYLFIAVSLVLIRMLLKSRANETDRKLLLFSLLGVGASVCYSYAMAQQFPLHDYYFLDSFFLPLAVLIIPGLSVVRPEQKSQAIMLWIIALTGSALMLTASWKVQQKRYASYPWDKTEIARNHYAGSKAFLDSLHIDSQSRILVLDAYTSNVPLLLMDRKGFTVIETSSENIEAALYLPFEYIVIQNSVLASDVLRQMPSLAQKLEPVANNGRIGLYTYHPDATDDKSWQALLMADRHKGHLTQLNCFGSEDEYVLLSDTLLHTSTETTALLFQAFSSFPPKVTKGLDLVTDASKGDDFHFYQSVDLRPFFENRADSVNICCFIPFPDQMPDSIRIKTYLWNPGKNTLCLQNQIVQFTKYHSP